MAFDRTDTLPDPMHAVERVRTLCALRDVARLMQTVSAGAATVKGSRSRFDALVSDMSDFLPLLEDEVEGR